MNVLLVKLGGSLITDKSGTARARSGVIQRLAAECQAGAEGTRARIIIGHGSGSFGHAAAARHGIDGKSSRRHSPAAIAAVQNAAHDLHRRVVAALGVAGVPAFSAPPSAFGTGTDGRLRRAGPTPAPWMIALERGLVPVTCGDVVFNADGQSTICSTEAVLSSMTDRLAARGHRVRRAIWLGVTDGVLDADGRTITTLSAQGKIAAAGASGNRDVTGGMRLRVDTATALARKGVESWILDGRAGGVLEAALRGKRLNGTRVAPRS